MAVPAAGDIILADHFSATWTTYTPTWVASAGTPAIGNGTLAGRYFQLGKTVHFSFRLIAGSTTTYGTAGAYWQLGLPTLGNAATYHAFAAMSVDAATADYPLIGAVRVGEAVVELYKPGSGRFVNNSPFTFGSGDQLWVSGTYETV